MDLRNIGSMHFQASGHRAAYIRMKISKNSLSHFWTGGSVIRNVVRFLKLKKYDVLRLTSQHIFGSNFRCGWL